MQPFCMSAWVWELGGGEFKNYLCSTGEHSTTPMLKWMRQHQRASLLLKQSTAISSNIFNLFHEALNAEFDSKLAKD